MTTTKNIVYGNPTLNQKQNLLTESYLDIIFSNFQTHHFPLNDSDFTKTELNTIAKNLETICKDENAEILKNYLLFDRNVGQSIIQIFAKEKLDIVDLVNNVIKDIYPIVLKLKYFYNRPRPIQLAYYYQLKLFPFDSKTCDSPSYPCEKVIIGNVLLSMIKEKHPNHSDLCDNFMETIQNSRVYLGHNYQSDVDFSIEIADAILSEPKIISKYNL